MKTPEEWEKIFFSLDRPEWTHVERIEAIQRDALSSAMASTSAQDEFEITKSQCEKLEMDVEFWKAEVGRMRAKWHETRRYLRAANKGAQRNAEALALSQNRYWEIINSDKRWKERDMNDHKTIVWNWLLMSDEEYRLRCGELSSQDLRNIRAVLKAMLGTSLLKRP